VPPAVCRTNLDNTEVADDAHSMVRILLTMRCTRLRALDFLSAGHASTNRNPRDTSVRHALSYDCQRVAYRMRQLRTKTQSSGLSQTQHKR